jgi:hypothetical protein
MILIRKLKENSKPPKFDAILSFEINGGEVRKSLMDISQLLLIKIMSKSWLARVKAARSNYPPILIWVGIFLLAF